MNIAFYNQEGLQTIHYYVSLLLIKKATSSQERLQIVRPILEYTSLIWSPHAKKDIDALERVQRRFTKSFSNIRSLPYSTRLTRLDLQPLYVRRHIDLITCFRLIHGLAHLDYTSFCFPCLNSVTRGHPYTLIKPPVCLNTNKFSFFSFLAPLTLRTICPLVP